MGTRLNCPSASFAPNRWCSKTVEIDLKTISAPVPCGARRVICTTVSSPAYGLDYGFTLEVKDWVVGNRSAPLASAIPIKIPACMYEHHVITIMRPAVLCREFWHAAQFAQLCLGWWAMNLRIDRQFLTVRGDIG